MTLPLAACRGEDTELWFAPEHEAAAKAICRRCPIRAACLERFRCEEFGVFGGLDERERRALRGFIRPTVRGLADHGTRRRYVTCSDGDNGGPCAKCRRGNARYVALCRSRGPVTHRGRIAVVNVIERPVGRGCHRAYPGQLVLNLEVAS